MVRQAITTSIFAVDLANKIYAYERDKPQFNDNGEIKLSKKLSIVRFKPKPEYFDEFVQKLKLRHQSDLAMTDTKIMIADNEVVGIVVRDTEIFSKNVQSGVEYLDTVRHMLQEYDPVNRHTIPLTGDLVE